MTHLHQMNLNTEYLNDTCYRKTSELTFKAARTACVFDFTPTVADPCFTASIAYSI